MTEQKKVSFFGTLPGILTAVAAIVTAIGTLLIALDKVGFLQDDAKDVLILSPKSNNSKQAETPSKETENTTTTPMVSGSLTGEWVFSSNPISEVEANGKKDKSYRSGFEDTVELTQEGNHITGRLLWTTKGCTDLSIEGDINGEQIYFVSTYNGKCCRGTKIQFTGKLVAENEIVGAFSPKGLPLSNCRVYWTETTATKN